MELAANRATAAKDTVDMNSTKMLKKLKKQFELDRNIELKRSAHQAMERAKTISQTERSTSEAFIRSVTEDSGIFTAQVSKPLIDP